MMSDRERAPLVSVVVPSYNCGRYVAGAVESALSQTYRDLEIIVVDDGSTDDTRERLSPYAGRIRYIHQENRGLPGARNAGILAARGVWIALLDADDLWHRRKVEVQLAAIGSLGRVGLVGSPPAVELPDDLPADPPVRLLSVRDHLLSAPFGPSSVLIKAECLKTIGLFDEGLKSIEDRDMWLRLAAKYPVAQVRSPCWWYRRHPGQMSSNAHRMYANSRAVLSKFFRDHPEYRRFRGLAGSHLYLDAAMAYSDQGDRLAALLFVLRSLARRPWSLDDRNRNSHLIRAKLLLRLAMGDRLFGSLKRSRIREKDLNRQGDGY
jgi:glycosyltransferase involved in cell wall biosynthesis